MAKSTTKQVFKQYCQVQNLLLPPSLEDLISPHHLVRVVNRVIDSMDLNTVVNSYQGGGTSAYDPRMMVKVLLYAYSMKIYTGRRIAQALRQDVTFMWLAAYNRPDFRTINNFRSGVLKQSIEELFTSLLQFLIAEEYVKFENYFCDGSTFAANANRHKMVWKKNAHRYEQATEAKCRTLFKQIDALNTQEQQAYGSQDLPEEGNAACAVTREQIEQQANKLNDIIEKGSTKRIKRKASTLKKQLLSEQDNLLKYQEQQQISGPRSGYSKTDTDATAMKMKNEEILPAYNVLTGSENQFIIGYSIHQKTNDGACFKAHLDQFKQHGNIEPCSIIADSIFGTQENYQLLDEREIASYVKFPLYHKEQSKAYKKNPFNKDNFIYDNQTDAYICPNNKQLIFRYVKTITNKNGYRSFSRLYECENCHECPFAEKCKKSQIENRTIKINESLEHYKQQARRNLATEQGDKLKRQRGTEIESCFGDIKMNGGFRRFYLRGLPKVQTEFGLIAMAHNIRKICLKLQYLPKAA